MSKYSLWRRTVVSRNRRCVCLHLSLRASSLPLASCKSSNFLTLISPNPQPSWYGWSARASVHWIMPIIGAGIFSFAMMAAFLPIQLYLVDSFRYAASAIAAATVLRSVFGFAFPLFGEQMFGALHNGPGNSLLAGLAIVTGIPFPIWIYYRGEKIRLRSNANR